VWLRGLPSSVAVFMVMKSATDIIKTMQIIGCQELAFR
jgi:hypothetical protein